MRQTHRTPDFENILCILNKKKPSRPTLFEFFISDEHLFRISGQMAEAGNSLTYFKALIKAYEKAGYDYATIPAWHTDTLAFPHGASEQKHSKSQNQGAVITGLASFEAYPWPDANAFDYSVYEKLRPELPEGMKLLACSNGGVLENATELAGFENLCFLYMLEPDFTKQLFDAIGQRLLDYYRNLVDFDSIGALIVNDDWGYKNQTMFPPEMMREYVFPWHRRIVEVIHDAGKKAILHSCGNLLEIMPEIIDDLKYDAKHSFEDQILPVEEAYENWQQRIAVMGGIDLNFICAATPTQVSTRALKLLEQTAERGAYGLGSGNSIPDYVPHANFLAMIDAVAQFEA